MKFNLFRDYSSIVKFSNGL